MMCHCLFLSLGLITVSSVLMLMAKSKNHTNHNQITKAHRNGIKKPPKFWAANRAPMRGMDAKFVRNQKYARAGVMKKLEEAKKKVRKATKMLRTERAKEKELAKPAELFSLKLPGSCTEDVMPGMIILACLAFALVGLKRFHICFKSMRSIQQPLIHA
eukprot:gnl/MRDRNA2_/MRDRNA2_119283_c0_seq1.p1 gnl/MRDRNA2_/MRDRNA2_119283_c0~~gnl/MRDRNA2_/MRDRNA2_119283_c0_seq1.p1  ORF type:complete len:159 (+),score=23.98 gnl/MRDRNA2_/MRDRNA2_119283_c0_seq1:146-622(+)